MKNLQLADPRSFAALRMTVVARGEFSTSRTSPHALEFSERATPLLALAPGEPLFFEARSLALAPAQEIELGPADVRVAQDLDLFNAWRMQRKGPLHADAVGRDTPDGEIGVGASPPANPHDRATDQLDPLAIAFYDTKMNLHVVADPEVVEIGLEPDIFLELLFFY
jgi:hypothetical protein